MDVSVPSNIATMALMSAEEAVEIFNHWFIVVGAVFLLMALSSSVLTRLPLSTSMLYLAVGIFVGPYALQLIQIDPVEHAAIIERITEVAVIISLFAAGLKLRVPLRDPLWRLPVILASWSMLLTVGLITLVGTFLLGLPLGVSVLLGAVLAPTDPVLASDVQVAGPHDRDELRFTLTGEAGLNDGTAFPFVMLGLGLLGLGDLGAFGWRWLAVDVCWAIAGGLAIGALVGTAAGRIILYVRRVHKEAIGLDDFLALGVIALSYGLALSLHTYGFLAVFAAGLALRKIEEQSTGSEQEPDEIVETADIDDPEELAAHPEVGPAYMTRELLGFTEQLERIGEVAVMVLIGAMLSLGSIPSEAIWFVPLLFLVIRPIAVNLGLFGSQLTTVQRGFISWFGVRGIGSIYYLMYAIVHGVDDQSAEWLTGMTLAVVATSVVVHGISVTPLMERYRQEAS
jgi:NhaP-type Na+/H+ or K+/H+ antiporter